MKAVDLEICESASGVCFVVSKDEFLRSYAGTVGHPILRLGRICCKQVLV
jgi:hypothetical protein